MVFNAGPLAKGNGYGKSIHDDHGALGRTLEEIHPAKIVAENRGDALPGPAS